MIPKNELDKLAKAPPNVRVAVYMVTKLMEVISKFDEDLHEDDEVVVEMKEATTFLTPLMNDEELNLVYRFDTAVYQVLLDGQIPII